MKQPFRKQNRLGFHYFPDTFHYREQDLQTWLPELKGLGAGWLTLIAPSKRAIPEFFLQGLLEADIEPVLHLPLPVHEGNKDSSLTILFENYARWGIQYLTFFDQPNLRRAWSEPSWAQSDLVERFIDVFIHLARSALQAGLTPVFPPLEPGGDYWDTAFLQSALRSLQRRNLPELLDSLALGCYAWMYDRPVDWGKGGPERWPAAQPYYTPQGSQDQIGFRIFDWYQAIAQAEIGRMLPILIMRAGSRLEQQFPAQVSMDRLSRHARENLQIVDAFTEPTASPADPSIGVHKNVPSGDTSPEFNGIDQVICANFWLLSCEADSPHAPDAWYKADGNTLPVVNALKQYITRSRARQDGSVDSKDLIQGDFIMPPDNHPIDHYLLVPIYAWGVAEWDLEAIRPFIQKNHPTMGFSAYEARLAARVTIFGEPDSIAAETLDLLKMAGCQVDWINRDGMLLAI
jgi:hypothetical protein